tara:strand:+ start:5528 stop:5929 length:402 start_codon:yes stop_codon:yes gene_type:complete
MLESGKSVLDLVFAFVQSVEFLISSFGVLSPWNNDTYSFLTETPSMKMGNMKDKQQDHGSAMTQGVVRKIDKEARTLTIKHGPIKNLGMPPMTMVFQTDDSVAIDQLETGQNIKFRAADMNGKMTVTEVEPAS